MCRLSIPAVCSQLDIQDGLCASPSLRGALLQEQMELERQRAKQMSRLLAADQKYLMVWHDLDGTALPVTPAHRHFSAADHHGSMTAPQKVKRKKKKSRRRRLSAPADADFPPTGEEPPNPPVTSPSVSSRRRRLLSPNISAEQQNGGIPGERRIRCPNCLREMQEKSELRSMLELLEQRGQEERAESRDQVHQQQRRLEALETQNRDLKTELQRLLQQQQEWQEDRDARRSSRELMRAHLSALQAELVRRARSPGH